jgi:hypothetical protein
MIIRARFFRNLCLAVCAALTLAAAPARAIDYTDIWYNPTESGWGVNVVQSDSFIFVTFFIYGSDRRPTWYTGQLRWDGVRFTGTLFLTQGSYYLAPWIPGQHAATPVGVASFTPSDINAYTATLSYTVDGVGSVTKSIQRQTLTSITIAGNYVGGQSGSYFNCNNSDQNTSYTDTYDNLRVTQTGGFPSTATLIFAFTNNLTCTLRGTLEQYGQLYRIPNASYTCEGAIELNTTAVVFELKATSLGIEGRLAASNAGGGCSESATFAAALK